MQLVCRALLLAVGLSGLAGAQAPPEAPKPDTKPWRWSDSIHKPSQAWHTDVALQARMYADASAAMQTAVGLELPGPVEVVLFPGVLFPFVSMEVGAKDGSLGLDMSVSRAIEMLSLGKHEQAGASPMEEGDHDDGVMAARRGCYAPKHFKRMIFVDPHCDEEHAAATLRHELVHALQDEAFPFATFFNFDGLSPDEKWARQALEEGYAELVARPAEPDAAVPTPQRSDWTRRFLAFLYGDGERLVTRVQRPGESKAELLTRLFARPPRATREVLHPELYAARLEQAADAETVEPPVECPLRTTVLGALAEADVQAAWTSRLGEFGLQSLLAGLGLEPDAARELAAAWRDDTILNAPDWRHPTLVACMWCLQDAAAAERLETTLARLIEAQRAALPPETVALRAGELQLRASVADEPWPQLIVARQGNGVAFIAGEALRPVLDRLRAQP